MKKKINFTLIFNIVVIAISVSLVAYFCFSEDGLADLIRSNVRMDIFWIFMAVVCQLSNMFIDSVITWLYLRRGSQPFSLLDGIKNSCVGSFYSCITPSSTGGQPMQIVFLSKKHIDIGFAMSCMTQKFLVFQITTTLVSVTTLIVKFDFFVKLVDNPILWVFVLLGFLSQVTVTSGFLIVSFSTRLSRWLLKVTGAILKRLKFVKDPQGKIDHLTKQVEMFHSENKALLKQPKLLLISYILIFIQIMIILAVPYCIYRSFCINDASLTDMMFSQSFVNLASSLVPLPGATGAAELSFSVFYNRFFGKNILKSALLLWRTITYYFVIIICFPFSMLTKTQKTDASAEEQNGEASE